MKRILICDTFMFVAYAINIICLVLFIKNIPEKAREWSELGKDLPFEKKAKLHDDKLAKYQLKLFLPQLFLCIIIVLMSIFDGISGDPDNKIMNVPFVICLIVWFGMTLLGMIAYRRLLKKKYKLILDYEPPLPTWRKLIRARSVNGTGQILVWFVDMAGFAANTSIVVQTILILTGCYA